MPYEPEGLRGLPKLVVYAEIKIGKQRFYQEEVVPAVVGETVTISAKNLAAHVVLLNHDFYGITVRAVSTQTGSFLYDGRVFRVDRHNRICRIFSYPNIEDPEEEIRLTFGIIPREK